MILTLLWLTVSTSFLVSAQQELASQGKSSNASFPLSANEEESSSPFGSTTEEKAPSGNSLSEEYLHDVDHEEYFRLTSLQYDMRYAPGVYIAFHGELLVPPPNVA